MTERESSRVLEGRVEIDDSYLGGERPGKRGRGSENKASFVAAVQTTEDGKPVVACFVHIPFTRKAIEACMLSTSVNTQTVTWPRFNTVLTAASILAPSSSASFALRRVLIYCRILLL
ncbi:hypothetical protein W01_05470 [Candidatus Nitrotoga sp. AM1P]|nr:hypothetical protein W01_05470 [Candidatus Nitrotoga sp. AM1P]